MNILQVIKTSNCDLIYSEQWLCAKKNNSQSAYDKLATLVFFSVSLYVNFFLKEKKEYINLTAYKVKKWRTIYKKRADWAKKKLVWINVKKIHEWIKNHSILKVCWG